MATLTDRIPLAKINEQAREITFSKFVITVIAGLFYAIGWIASMCWLSLAWCVTAVKVGFQEGKATKGQHERTG